MDMNGEIIKVFPSATAASGATGIDKSQIAKCAKTLDTYLSAGWFQWAYVPDDMIHKYFPIKLQTESAWKRDPSQKKPPRIIPKE